MKKLLNWYFGNGIAADDKSILARRQKISQEARNVMGQAVDVIATGAVVFYAVAKNMR
jgi:hypothetical protein